MPEFLTTRGVTSKIESVIANSKNTVILISPYLNFIPDNFISRIKKAIQKKVRVVLVCREYEGIHRNEIEKLQSIEGLEIFQNTNVHAKAYFNEKEAVITSFNISEKSEQNNVEFGVYFTRSDSKEMYEGLSNEFELLIENASPILSTVEVVGHCIRCNAIIEPDPQKPLCYNCYAVWSQFENYSWIENYCHICGNSRKTSMKEPVCADCGGNSIR